jgi:Xaa-Pro aminopeptidase
VVTLAREDTLYFQTDFDAAELSSRRKRLMTQMEGGLAVLAGTSEVPGFDPIRQSNDFYYLTGVEVPHAYLTMDAASGVSILYLPARDEKHEASDGPSLCADDGYIVRRRTGIDEVRPLAQISNDLAGLQRTFWVMRASAEMGGQCQDTLRRFQRSVLDDPLDGRLSRETHLMARLGQLSPRAEFRDFAPLVHRARLIKSSSETEVMRHSSRLAAMACAEAMRATRPGVFEFQLGAAADYIFKVNGAQGAGYRPIIATGANIWLMHYWRNNAPLVDGDLVIFDYAPDYNNYTSDIGRMWPVNGIYSAAQRELYGFVLECHRTLLNIIRPGRTKDDILAEFAELMLSVVGSMQWSKSIYKAAALRLLGSKRPLSHGVGMSVHEADQWASRPIEAGLVFAVDPELFIPEEKTYIRVEDTVLVTPDGIENLTADCPIEMDDLEHLIRDSQSMLQNHPALHRNFSR